MRAGSVLIMDAHELAQRFGRSQPINTSAGHAPLSSSELGAISRVGIIGAAKSAKPANLPVSPFPGHHNFYQLGRGG